LSPSASEAKTQMGTSVEAYLWANALHLILRISNASPVTPTPTPAAAMNADVPAMTTLQAPRNLRAMLGKEMNKEHML
jgi:hypothetical protein